MADDDDSESEEIDLEEYAGEIEALAEAAKDLAGQAEALAASQRDGVGHDVRETQRRIKSAGYRIERIREADERLDQRRNEAKMRRRRERERCIAPYLRN